MTESKFDGEIEGKPVKVIVQMKSDANTQYFAKSKNQDAATPHFEEYTGILYIHEDSADGGYKRIMENPQWIGSGTLAQGRQFVASKGLDVAILPKYETADGFTIDTNPSGVEITMPTGSQYCLMAFGKWGNWILKKKYASI